MQALGTCIFFILGFKRIIFRNTFLSVFKGRVEDLGFRV